MATGRSTTWTFALAMLLACASVQAQQVIYTCVGKAGARILQDTPCADSGARQLAARSYETPRVAPDAARRLEAIDRQVHAEWAADRASAQPRYRQRAVAARDPQHATDSRRGLQRSRCERARSEVEAASRSRHARRDRAQLEDEATDACFAL